MTNSQERRRSIIINPKTKAGTDNKYKGEYPVYYEDESNCPKRVDFVKCTVGDYISDSYGVVLRILDIRVSERIKSVITAVGVDSLTTKNGSIRSFKFFRDRKVHWKDICYYFYRTHEVAHARLTNNDKLLLFYIIVKGFDIYKAYECATGNKITRGSHKYKAKTMAKGAVAAANTNRFVKQMIKDHLTSAGITPEAWLERLTKAVPEDGIKTELQLEIWGMIAKTIPEIRKEMFPDENTGRLNGAIDTPYSLVCEICNDEGTYTPEGFAVAIPCPACKKKNMLNPANHNSFIAAPKQTALQEQQNKLKV